MSHSAVRASALGGLAMALVFALASTAGAKAVGDGMLREQDVGLAQAKAPHETTLIRSSQVAPGSCADSHSREYKGRGETFAVGSSSGASLNEYVVDFASAAEASAAFDDFQADDQATLDCGDTAFRSGASIKKAPKGVGSRRYTFVSRPTVGGKKVTVTSICAVRGKHLVLLVFQAWPASKPAPAAVAKKAVKLLA
jgi:hypothetical protein